MLCADEFRMTRRQGQSEIEQELLETDVRTEDGLLHWFIFVIGVASFWHSSETEARNG